MENEIGRRLGATYSADMFPHTTEERQNIINGAWEGELPVVEDEAYPKVVHENGEARHDSHDSPRATKLISTLSALEGVVQEVTGVETYSRC